MVSALLASKSRKYFPQVLKHSFKVFNLSNLSELISTQAWKIVLDLPNNNLCNPFMAAVFVWQRWSLSAE